MYSGWVCVSDGKFCHLSLSVPACHKTFWDIATQRGLSLMGFVDEGKMPRDAEMIRFYVIQPGRLQFAFLMGEDRDDQGH